MSDSNNPAGHIPSTAANLAMTAAGTLAAEQTTATQSAPAAATSAVADAVTKASQAIVGDGLLQRASAELLIVLHASETQFQNGALKPLRSATVTRQGGREVKVNLYSPFHRHNPAKAKSMGSGLVRNALDTIFSTFSHLNGLNLVIANGDPTAALTEAAKALAGAVRRSLVVGSSEELGKLATEEGQQEATITLKDLVRVDSWVRPADEEDEEPAPTITVALHIHAGALYDAEDPGVWLKQQSSLLETFAKQYPAATFKLAIAVGSETLVQGNSAALVNFLSEDENTIPYGARALRESGWAPEEVELVLWNSDFLFLKNPDVILGDTAEAA